MDDETLKKVTNGRLSLASLKSDYSSCKDESEINDPIHAYFSKRCSTSSKTYFDNYAESDTNSSVDVIDLDNLLLFNDGEDSENLRLTSESLEQLKLDLLDTDSNRKYSSASTASETHLEKQRVLAQKALQKLKENTEIDLMLTPEKSRNSSALKDISSKLNVKDLTGKEGKNNWFEPNFSPDTPRYFNDELSSIGGEEGSSYTYDSKLTEQSQARQSMYAEKVNLMMQELSNMNLNSDLQFESQTKEEQIKLLEEEEKKFRLENAGVLHNSCISQFSGVADDDDAAATISNSQKPGPKMDRLSIGQFFNLRSNRVSSIVGSAIDDTSISNLELEADSPTFTRTPVKNTSKNDTSLPVVDVSKSEKPKPRRCVSTCDLTRIPEVPKKSRMSNDSCSSNSTILIQNILAEMESGLSGSEIYEKLIKSYKRNKAPEKKTESERSIGNSETPKSSKVFHKKEPELKSKLIKKLGKENSTRISLNEEFKENKPLLDLKGDLTLPSVRMEKIKQLKNSQGFDASTPKLQATKSQLSKFRSHGKVLMEGDEWEAPRISVIQSASDLNKSESSEDEKTVTVNSTITSDPKKQSTIILNDTATVEDTIVAGDLTVISQRIEEMKEDGVCIVRSTTAEEPVLLTVIQKLADLPKGSVDCSALTPLLRDQFPELLSSLPSPSKDMSSYNSSLSTREKESDYLMSQPDSWIKIPAVMGITEKINACAEVTQTLLIPLFNISSKWLLISIKALKEISSLKKRCGIQMNDKWEIPNVVFASMKETLVPPGTQLSLQITFKPNRGNRLLDLVFDFTLKELLKKETEIRTVRVRINVINPLNNINVVPKDSINFGLIADQCSDHRTVQVSFDGICKLPITAYIEENNSQSKVFGLKAFGNALVCQRENDKKCGIIHYTFNEGEKQLLELRVLFQPNMLHTGDTIQEHCGTLILKIGSDINSNEVFQRIPVKGSVGLAKFLCSPPVSPIVFRASERGQPVTRCYYMKNTGMLPIAFSLKLIDVETKAEQDDNVFVAPKSFYLSRNDESAIEITFNANCMENCVKRLLTFRVEPNSHIVYDVELIGIIKTSESRPLSRASAASSSAKSVTSSESTHIKLLTNTNSLSWASVPLEKESRLSFQLKIVHNTTTSARIYFKKNVASFKLVNDNGEKVQKIRKVLKPDCPCTVTVVFRPDLVGPHHNVVLIELSHSGRKKMILLNGFGGTPNLFLGNVKSDLMGCKILTLQNASNSQFFINTLEFKNEGRIPGFILIRPSMEVLSLSRGLTISPSCCVIAPDSSVTVRISQKLKRDELELLLSGRDISKLATLSVIMGDETSRQRVRKLVENGKLSLSERLKILTDKYCYEKEINLKLYEDSPTLESQFLKSFKIVEVAVVVERSCGVLEPSILEDGDDTAEEFVTIISAYDNTILSTKCNKNIDAQSNTSERKITSKECDLTMFSSDSIPSHSKITKWLETLDFPSNKT